MRVNSRNLHTIVVDNRCRGFLKAGFSQQEKFEACKMKFSQRRPLAYVMSLNFGSRSSPHQNFTISCIRTCLQRAICLGAGTDVLTCQRQLTLNTTQLPSQQSIIRLNYVEVEEGREACSWPQRVMGNYFRQIYTSSHAEWWTTVCDPRRLGTQARFFSAPWVDSDGRGLGGAGGAKGRLGD